jgi:hypothetical protein
MKTTQADVRRFCSAICVIAAATLCGSSMVVAQETPKVSVTGISINRSIPGMEQELPMGETEGVKVSICLQVEGQHIIAVADEQKKLPVITTDGGKKLAEDEGWSTFGTEISENGQAVWIPVRSADVPPSGTTALKVSGELTLITGSEPGESDHEFALVQGTKGKLGKAEVSIEEISKNEFGDGGLVVSFSSKSKEFSLIREIRFLSADGSEIESSTMGSGSFGFGDDVTYSRSFSLAGEPKKVKIHVSFFAKTSELKVPVDAEATLGLGD